MREGNEEIDESIKQSASLAHYERSEGHWKRMRGQAEDCCSVI